MCPPEHFGVLCEINPWMHREVRVDAERAREQWDGLKTTLEQAGDIRGQRLAFDVNRFQLRVLAPDGGDQRQHGYGEEYPGTEWLIAERRHECPELLPARIL